MGNGTISKVKKSKDGYGNEVRLVMGSLEVVYGHLDSIAVRQGQFVAEGEKIGVIGTTGFSSGVHLHLGVREWENGQVLNY